MRLCTLASDCVGKCQHVLRYCNRYFPLQPTSSLSSVSSPLGPVVVVNTTSVGNSSVQGTSTVSSGSLVANGTGASASVSGEACSSRGGL